MSKKIAGTNTSVAYNLTSTTKAAGSLFNVVEADQVENGPLMTGNLMVDGERIPLSGFARKPDGGTEYLSLSLGNKDTVHFYGKLFRQQNKRNASAPDYSGDITLLPCSENHSYTEDDWNNAETLQVCGWRRRNADMGARIVLNVSPAKVGDDELAF